MIFRKNKDIITGFLVFLLIGFLVPFHSANAESNIFGDFLYPFSVAGPDTSSLPSSNGTFTVRTDSANCIFTEFMPGPGVDCDSIVFVQTCKVSFWDGSKWVATKPGDIASGWGYRDGDTTADTTFVDHVYCEKDPYYNGDDDNDIGNKGSSGSEEKSFLMLSPAGPATPATMEDCPNVPDGNFPTGTSKVKMEFEVAAVCADDGSVLGSFEWEYNRDKGSSGNGTDSVTTTGTAPDTVSTGFTAALDTFVTNHTDGTGASYCPEKALDDLIKSLLDIMSEVWGFFPVSPIAGELVTAQFTVTNMSGEELIDLPVAFTLNGLQAEVDMIPLLLPGETQPVAFSFIAQQGPNVAQCIADCYGDHEESNEHNNGAVQVIEASGASGVPIFNPFVLTVLVLGLILTAALVIKKRAVVKR